MELYQTPEQLKGLAFRDSPPCSALQPTRLFPEENMDSWRLDWEEDMCNEAQIEVEVQDRIDEKEEEEKGEEEEAYSFVGALVSEVYRLLRVFDLLR